MAKADMIRYEFEGFIYWPEVDALRTPTGGRIKLSDGLGAVLDIFIQNAGSVLSLDELFEQGNFRPDANNNAVSCRVAELRKKIPGVIETVRGKGLRFTAPVKKIELIDKNAVAVVNESQFAGLHQEIAAIKSELRLVGLENQFLKNLLVKVMRHNLSDAGWARVIYETVEWASKRIIGPEQDAQINTLDGLGDSLGWALGHYRQNGSSDELRLAIQLTRYWCVKGLWSVGCTVLRDALAQYPEAAPDIQAQARAWLAFLSYCLDDYSQARQAATIAIKQSKETGDDESLARSLYTMAATAEASGDYTEARRLLFQSLRLAERTGADWLMASIHRRMGIVSEAVGDYLYSEKCLKKSKAKREELQDYQGIALVQSSLSAVTFAKGDVKQAKLCIDKAQETRNKEVLALCYLNLGRIEESGKQYAAAKTNFERSYELSKEIGDRRAMARALEGQARIFYLQGRERDAAKFYGTAANIRETIAAPLTPTERKTYGTVRDSLMSRYGVSNM